MPEIGREYAFATPAGKPPLMTPTAVLESVRRAGTLGHIQTFGERENLPLEWLHYSGTGRTRYALNSASADIGRAGFHVSNVAKCW